MENYVISKTVAVLYHFNGSIDFFSLIFCIAVANVRTLVWYVNVVFALSGAKLPGEHRQH
jgi:hypothetical protein